MAVESAKSFVKSFFEDDEFLKEFYKKGGLLSDNKKASEEEQNRRMVEIANEMGYDFNIDEYAKANEEYAKELGAWKTIKKIIHITKLAKSIEKELKKEAKQEEKK